MDIEYKYSRKKALDIKIDHILYYKGVLVFKDDDLKELTNKLHKKIIYKSLISNLIAVDLIKDEYINIKGKNLNITLDVDNDIQISSIESINIDDFGITLYFDNTIDFIEVYQYLEMYGIDVFTNRDDLLYLFIEYNADIKLHIFDEDKTPIKI